MPVTRRRRSRSRRRSRRKLTAGGPRIMGRALRRKRINQVDVRPFWFKYNSTIDWIKEGNTLFTIDSVLYNIQQFRQVLPLYDEYKVMGYIVRLFPSGVGTESMDPQGPARALVRGDHILMSDQNWPTGGAITSISSVINQGSCRMINARRPQRRTIFRPYGLPQWTSTETDPGGLVIDADPWSPAIQLYHENGTDLPAGQRIMWWYTIEYKVLFRGRSQNP